MREAKEELKRRIVHLVRNKLANYYANHQDRQNDERGREAIRISFAGIEEILKLIDRHQVFAPDDLPPLDTSPRQPQ